MFQQTIVIGNVGNDPELRYTASGVPVANFSVAANERWKSQDGQPQERTTWFRVAAWNKLAENCNQYLHKGSKVMVIGRVSAHAYIAADNAPKATIEVTATTVRFLSPAGNGKTEPGAFAEEAEEEEVGF